MTEGSAPSVTVCLEIIAGPLEKDVVMLAKTVDVTAMGIMYCLNLAIHKALVYSILELAVVRNKQVCICMARDERSLPSLTRTFSFKRLHGYSVRGSHLHKWTVSV